MENSDKKTKTKSKHTRQPSVTSVNGNTIMEPTSEENIAIEAGEENIKNDPRGARPKGPSGKSPQSKSKKKKDKKKDKKNKKNQSLNSFNMQLLEEELQKLNDHIEYAESYTAAAVPAEVPPQQVQQEEQASQTQSLYEYFIQQTGQQSLTENQPNETGPNPYPCPFCLAQALFEGFTCKKKLSRKRRRRARATTSENGRAADPVTEPPASSSGNVEPNNGPIPDPNSYRVTYYHVGNDIHTGWSYTTSDGTNNRVYRFPMTLDELLLLDPLRNPAPQ